MIYEFTTKKVYVTLFTSERDSLKRLNGKYANVKWSLDVEPREWGVEAISPKVLSLAIFWTEESTDGAEEIEREAVVYHDDLKINSIVKYFDDAFIPMIPINVDANLDKKIARVTFQI